MSRLTFFLTCAAAIAAVGSVVVFVVMTTTEVMPAKECTIFKCIPDAAIIKQIRWCKHNPSLLECKDVVQ